MTLDSELVSLLACPRCKGELERAPEDKGLICRACAVAYPVCDDIPIMLVEEAIPLAEWETNKDSACKDKA